MRLLPVFLASVVMLGSGGAFAQSVALAPGAIDCPPGEPDSVQISWTAPCESGDWLLDTEAGCRLWDWHPEPQDVVAWNGSCRAGLADGPGQTQWFEHGQPVDRFVGTYRNGKRDGPGQYVWNDRVRFDGNYVDDVPQGQGILKLEGDTFAGEWKGGCFTAKDGRVVAIGVPRASCGQGGGVRSNKLAIR